MPTNFPGSLDTTAQLSTSRADSTPLLTNHAFDHDTVNGAVLGVEAKLGFGSSTPTAGMTLTGTGTGSSAWQSGISFDAKARGAVDNGSTVNTASIQATINACSAAGGGSVWFPGHGTYITGNLQVPANITLRGDGAMLKASPALAVEIITPMGDNISLQGLWFDGNNACSIVGMGAVTAGFTMQDCTVQNARYALQAGLATSNIRLERNSISTCFATGFGFQAGVLRALISDNTFTNMIGSECIQVFVSAAPDAPGKNKDIVCNGNTFINTTYLAIDCQFAERVTISNNIVSGSGTNGLSIGPCTNVAITGNVVRDQSNYGIEIAVGVATQGNTNYTVTGNSLFNNALGIIADKVTNLSITGNTIVGTTAADGIRLTGPIHATVSGNTVTDPFANGISVLPDTSANPAVDTHVVGNTFVFSAARTATPCAINIGSSNRTTFENNLIETAVDVTSGALNYQGPVIFTGTSTYSTVRDNTILATTAAVAKHVAVSVQGGATATAVHIVGNRIRNFQVGIDTTNSADTATIVQSNSVINCTTPYALNAATQPVVGFGISGTEFMGTGVPSNALGGNGDFFRRSDGTVAAHTVMYHKEGGSWIATGA